MRYYSIILSVNSDRIEEKATVDFKEYRSEKTLAAVNEYMYRHAENDVRFFAYREEGGLTYAAFTYNERRSTFEEAYDYIRDQLFTLFRISKFKSEPSEITMYQFFTMIMEGRRRSYLISGRYIEDCNLDRLYPDWKENTRRPWGYEFSEMLIPEEDMAVPSIYDQGFIKELANIEENVNTSAFTGNPVHYVISARSREAAEELTTRLTHSLLKAGRVSGRRVSIVRDISPHVYTRDNKLEDIIENNYGGVIVFDLSLRFAHAAEQYGTASEFFADLFARYRNKCLFIFTYSMEEPGFAFYVLKQISEKAVTVALREGEGDRKAALSYLKSLIRNSEYSGYAGQANEYLKRFPADVYSQSDVLRAFDQFGSWCINRNVLHAYDYELSDSFMLERDGGSAYERLNSMIGLDIVKKQINSIIASYTVDRERKNRGGNKCRTSCLHMVFSGNPGTAKTTVARLFAGIAKEKEILQSGIFVERSGVELDKIPAEYLIRSAFKAAEGGVLFIDEAYALHSEVAVTTLIQELENRRDKVIVILAGYSERMKEFMKRNEGLTSRIPNWVDFPDYSADELTDIFRLMADESGFRVTDDALAEARYIFEKARNKEDFGNGRYVRNILERAIQNQSVRLLESAGQAEDIRKRDLFLITREDICMLDEGLKHERKPGTAAEELEEMIGLSSVKTVIRKALACYKLNRLCIDRGLPRDKAAMHMVFTGNPGTAKTTVARLFAEILKDEKVLSAGSFTEVGRADLVGSFVGSTAPLIKRRFREARGGILFIDEAYSLCDGRENGFGDEAINTIVQEMENHRDDVIVIFAGYPEPMERFLERNPGMRSRIAFHVPFEDYSTDELCGITGLMARKKNLTITDGAMEKLRAAYDEARTQADYGNGRFVRKMLEEAEMNMAVRLLQDGRLDGSTDLITTIEECDIPEPQQKKKSGTRQIGFAA